MSKKTKKMTKNKTKKRQKAFMVYQNYFPNFRRVVKLST